MFDWLFRLSIGLRVVAGAHVEFGFEHLPQASPEVSNEPRITVTHDGSRHAMVTSHFAQHDSRKVGSSARGVRRCSMNHLAQPIHKYDNSVKSGSGLG